MMCGIIGIFNLNGEPVSENTLERMSKEVSHRGPDGRGLWSEGQIGFAHRRLAIIDLSPLGYQPMHSKNNKAVITYNGEIYNFQSIRSELERLGHVFNSKTDTEVILNSYLEWGTKCVERFNGMFAFAIWDVAKKELFLARDRYGIKPLYYTQKNGQFIFGSEIKSLLKHPDISVKVSSPALNEYFTFQNIFSDGTLFEGIKLLPAGSICTVSSFSSAPDIRTYWDFNFYEKQLFGEEEEFAEELDRLFDQAVNRQLISDVEIGTYLSGGIDSGGIACIAANSIPNLKSFTGGFDLSSATGLELGFDERSKAEFLSNLYKTEHYEIVLKAGDMERSLKSLVWHLEDLRVGQSYPNFYVAKLASKFVKVVLSGTGGDELFGGYPWRYYRSDHPEEDLKSYAANYYQYWQRLIDDSAKQSFFQPKVQKELNGNSTLDVFSSVLAGKKFTLTSPEEYVNCSLYFETKTFLHGLLLVEDKLSMAYGLETRVPFLDNDLVDFATKLPTHFRLRNTFNPTRIDENDTKSRALSSRAPTSDGKVLLRKVLSRYVSEEYSNYPKQGFSGPDASWFKGESIEYVKAVLLNKKARIYEYLQPETTKELLEEHFEGEKNRRLLIWSLLCFEWWNQIFDP